MSSVNKNQIPKIYVTCSNGIYIINEGTKNIEVKESNTFFDNFLKKGFYGISLDSKNQKVYVAARIRLSPFKHKKPTTDALLYSLNPKNNRLRKIARIKDIHDLHQIAISRNDLFLTDTGKNRVFVFDIERNRTRTIINIGKTRNDINHLNTLLVEDGVLKIGLNNSGRASQILSIPLETINNNIIEAEKVGSYEVLNDVTHMHDLIYFDNKVVCCSSKEGMVKDIKSNEVLFKDEYWIRGLAMSKDYFYVGASQIKKRSKRHSKKMDGYVFQLDRKNFNMVNRFTLKKAGQVHDLIAFE